MQTIMNNMDNDGEENKSVKMVVIEIVCTPIGANLYL